MLWTYLMLLVCCQQPLFQRPCLKSKLFFSIQIPFADSLGGHYTYLINTRPNISYVMHFLSQFIQHPTLQHHQVAQHIVRYIKENLAQGLFFPLDFVIHLKSFSGFDWVSCQKSRMSAISYCIFLGSSLILWKSKKQTTMSRSSSKAKYRALTTTSCEIQWITYMLLDLHIDFDIAIVLYCDNQAARLIILPFISAPNTLIQTIVWFEKIYKITLFIFSPSTQMKRQLMFSQSLWIIVPSRTSYPNWVQ